MLGRRGLGAAALGLAGARQALAQDAARGPVTIIVPWGPGGSADTLARLLAQKLSQDLGQSFVVENRPGASGIIGHAAVARARPDGSTVLFAASATYAMVPHLLPLPYDNATAFAPIGLILQTPLESLGVDPKGEQIIQAAVADVWDGSLRTAQALAGILRNAGRLAQKSS